MATKWIVLEWVGQWIACSDVAGLWDSAKEVDKHINLWHEKGLLRERKCYQIVAVHFDPSGPG